MIDVLVVLVVTAFFGLAVAYVALCDRIVGADPIDRTDGEVSPTSARREEAAA